MINENGSEAGGMVNGWNRGRMEKGRKGGR